MKRLRLLHDGQAGTPEALVLLTQGIQAAGYMPRYVGTAMAVARPLQRFSTPPGCAGAAPGV
jgi:hypothetical protein